MKQYKLLKDYPLALNEEKFIIIPSGTIYKQVKDTLMFNALINGNDIHTIGYGVISNKDWFEEIKEEPIVTIDNVTLIDEEASYSGKEVIKLCFTQNKAIIDDNKRLEEEVSRLRQSLSFYSQVMFPQKSEPFKEVSDKQWSDADMIDFYLEGIQGRHTIDIVAKKLETYKRLRSA
jgi:hypothetical protein